MSYCENITVELLSEMNFNEHSLDNFIRHQEVNESWREINGEWNLVANKFTEDWPLEQCRKNAEEILNSLNGTMINFGAFKEDEVVGYISLGKEFFGSKGQYLELISFEVSEPYRNHGIGRKLFEQVCKAARNLQVKKLYMSTHSSKESHAAYCRLGCVSADEINPVNVEKEPFDIQMEYIL